MLKRQWATQALEELQKGRTVKVTPAGSSMEGRIDAGDSVMLTPCDPLHIETGDVVLVRIMRRRHSLLVLHLVLDREQDRFLIGNNKGREDGWVDAESIFGKVTAIDKS